MKDWDSFNRMGLHSDKPFWGCVDSGGYWYDSAERFSTAVHWVCALHGQFDLDPEEETAFVAGTNHSIVHSSMLRKMYEAGLIK